MTKRTGPLRRCLLAGAVAMMMTVGGCASNPAGSNDSATSGGGSPHTGHDTTAAAAALPLRAGERFVNLAMPEPYTPTAPQGGTDEYRCLILDPHLTTPTFLSGSQFQPQNTPMVHHAVVFRGHPENAAAAHAKDAATPARGDLLRHRRHRRHATVDLVKPGHPAPPRPCCSRTSDTNCSPAACLRSAQIDYNLLAAGPGETTSPAFGCA